MASQQNGQITLVVPQTVAHARAIGDHAVVEQRAIPFPRFLQLVEDVGELREVMLVDRDTLR